MIFANVSKCSIYLIVSTKAELQKFDTDAAGLNVYLISSASKEL